MSRPRIGISEAQSDALYRRESPHRPEHNASVETVIRRATPKGLGSLVSWFLGEWASEAPPAIHVNEIWRDWVRLDESRSAEGGSVLGSHKHTDDFRSFIEGSPHATDPDGRYQRPMRSALARLAGRAGHAGPSELLGSSPFMARFLFRYGVSGGQLNAVAASMGIPEQVAPIYAERALYRIYTLYTVGPSILNEDAA